jgi:WS/DGAT/MGAT family acyltransferase
MKLGDRGRASFARLSLTDLGNLRNEDARTPMHFGALLVLAPGPPVDVDEVRRWIGPRLARVPELRRVILQAPPSCGRPLWVDDPHFSLEHHVVAVAVPAPGGDAELMETADWLLAPLLDRARPLWRLWLLTGLAGGRVALLFELHHAVADGLAAVALLSSLLDEAADSPAPQFTPAPPPRGLTMFREAWQSRLTSLTALAHPLAIARSAARMVFDARRVVRAWSAAPHSSVNGPRRGARRTRILRLDLEPARTIAHAAGGTINDVVLSIVAGGLRALLLARGEETEGIELLASVPVALRNVEAARSLGNSVGTLIAPLPVGALPAASRLARIVAATRAEKALPPVHADALIARLAALGLARPMSNRQRTVNVFVTNIPGPRAPLYSLGVRVDEIVPLTMLAGNIRLSFSIASYCGRLIIVVNADASVDNVDLLVDGMKQSWIALAAEPGSAGALA